MVRNHWKWIENLGAVMGWWGGREDTLEIPGLFNKLFD